MSWHPEAGLYAPCGIGQSPWMSQVPESITVAVTTWVEATEWSPKETGIACKGDVNEENVFHSCSSQKQCFSYHHFSVSEE